MNECDVLCGQVYMSHWMYVDVEVIIRPWYGEPHIYWKTQWFRMKNDVLYAFCSVCLPDGSDPSDDQLALLARVGLMPRLIAARSLVTDNEYTLVYNNASNLIFVGI